MQNANLAMAQANLERRQSQEISRTPRRLISSPSAVDPSVCCFCGVALERLIYPWGVASDIVEPCGCDAAVASRAAWDAAELQAKVDSEAREKFNRIKRVFEEIPEQFRDRTFGSFQVTDDNRSAYGLALTFPFTVGTKTSLLLLGDPGLGKTHLAAAIALEYVKRQESVVFGTVPSILARVKQAFSGNGPAEHEVMNAIMGCSLLVLDDLGKEKPSDWVDEHLYEIVNARYVRRLPVIVTTNVGLDAVQARYPWSGKAIVSRLYEMCRGAQVTGADFRRRRV